MAMHHIFEIHSNREKKLLETFIIKNKIFIVIVIIILF